jgi:hypothetical protein
LVWNTTFNVASLIPRTESLSSIQTTNFEKNLISSSCIPDKCMIIEDLALFTRYPQSQCPHHRQHPPNPPKRLSPIHYETGEVRLTFNTLRLYTSLTSFFCLDNSLNPLILATLTTPQHLRPFRLTGFLFTPTLVFTSYTSMHGYKTDAAGLLLAQSALYLLLASRRRHSLKQKLLSTRGIVRGATMALCVLDMAASGLAYVGGDRDKERLERESMRKDWMEKGK